jgi:SAM-dependent methyltransferase
LKEILPNCKDVIVCSECAGQLIFSKQKLLCPRCNKEWKVDEDGVIRFMGDANYFFGTSKEREEMNRFLIEVRNMSPRQFFHSISGFEKKYKFFSYSYCLDPARADWTVLGDFFQKVVVDLGCGYGGIALSLARRAKVVIAIDATLERIKFLSIVARFKNLKNIVSIHANVFDLPLRAKSVDVFIMVGLLEWLGTFSKSKSPFEVQQDFLRYLRNLLAKNGEIWIGIENRLNPLYFIGKTHHGDLPFTPLMPRFMANFIHRMFGKGEYRTWTYTRSEYWDLLRKSGFKDIEFFYSFPHYQSPKFILSSIRPRLLIDYLSSREVSQTNLKTTLALSLLKLSTYLHMTGVFTPTFFIKAKKS